MGAVYHGAFLTKGFRIKEIQLQDVNMYPIEVSNCLFMSVLFYRLFRFLMRRKSRLLARMKQKEMKSLRLR